MPELPRLDTDDFALLFGRENSEQTEKLCPVTELELDQMHEFKNHPFMVLDDRSMEEMMSSIQEHGVLHPAIVRPDGEGSYEIISGHRRHRACTKLGMKTMPVRIMDLDDSEAAICMTEANFQQRERMLISEKAKAYRLKYDALRYKRSAQGGSIHQQIGKTYGDSKKTVQRFIRLTYLIENLLDAVDKKRLPIIAGANLSYLSREAQQMVFEKMMEWNLHITAPLSRKILERFQKQGIDEIYLRQLFLLPEKTARKISLPEHFLGHYFPEHMSENEVVKILSEAMDQYIETHKEERK